MESRKRWLDFWPGGVAAIGARPSPRMHHQKSAEQMPIGSLFFMLLLLFAVPAGKASPVGKQPVHPISRPHRTGERPQDWAGLIAARGSFAMSIRKRP